MIKTPEFLVKVFIPHHKERCEIEKKVKKIVLIILIVLVGVPALAFLGLCAQSYYLNMNPDHVNLNKDGWVKVISFTTSKRNIPIEIYGRPGKEKNSGEFVVVRKGVLPFWMVAITPKYQNKNLWNKRISHNDSLKNISYYIFNGAFMFRVAISIIISLLLNCSLLNKDVLGSDKKGYKGNEVRTLYGINITDSSY